MPLSSERAAFVKHHFHNNKSVWYIEQRGACGYYEPFDPLEGFGVADREVTTRAAIQGMVPVIENGLHYMVEEEVAPEIPTAFTYTIQFPPGNWIRTRLSPYVRPGQTCKLNSYIIPECYDECLKFAFYLPEGSVRYLDHDPMLQPAEEGAPIPASTTVKIKKEFIYFGLKARYIRAITDDVPLYAIAYDVDTCQNCSIACLDGLFGGGDALAVPAGFTTDDGFLTETALVTAALPLGDLITDMYRRNDLIIAVHADTNDPATAASGGIAVTFDGTGGTLTDVSGIADPLFKILYANGWYYVFGSSGIVYKSLDAITWTAVTTPSATADFYDADVDGSTIYAGGVDTGADFLYTIYNDVFTDITANLPAVGTGVSAVEVLGKDHIIVGTLDGFVHENACFSSDPDFIQVFTHPTGEAIVGIDGDRVRQVLVTASDIYERSVLTNRDWTIPDEIYAFTPSGDYTDIRMCDESDEIYDGANTFVMVTDAGEIIILEPCPFE